MDECLARRSAGVAAIEANTLQFVDIAPCVAQNAAWRGIKMFATSELDFIAIDGKSS